MTLEQLRIFIAVAEREHVTAAAAALHLTQSAVSSAIRALEGQHGVALFDRVGRRVVLTATGRQFFPEARRVLAAAADAKAALDDMAGLKRGHLRLAASQTIANYWLPGRLAQFRARFPGVEVSLEIGNSEFVRSRVQDGVADCGLVEDDVTDPAFVPQTVGEDELVVVCPVAIQPSGRGLKAQMAGLPWVFREDGSGTRAIFITALARLGLAENQLHIVLELPSNEAVLSAVLAGGGAAALSRLVVAPMVASGALRQIRLPGTKRHFWLVRNGARGISPAEEALRQLLLPLRIR